MATKKNTIKGVKDQNVKEFLLKKMTEQWMNDNPDLINDIHNLVSEFMLFNMKWGTRLNPTDFTEEFITSKVVKNKGK